MPIIFHLPQDIGFNSNLYKMLITKKPDEFDILKRKLEDLTLNDEEPIQVKKQIVNKHHIENILKNKFAKIKL